MELGLIGLGKMGGNMRERIREAGHTVVGYDRNPDLADVGSLKELVETLPRRAPCGSWFRPARRPSPPWTSSPTCSSPATW
jgi:6-phosphogluconate dehydrogenase